MADPSAASLAILGSENLLKLIDSSSKIAAADDAKKFEIFVEMAFNVLHKLFRDKILNLTHDFPEGKLTKDGKRFWKAPKRFPNVMTFDKENANHINFIMAYANILRTCFGVMPETSMDVSTQVTKRV